MKFRIVAAVFAMMISVVLLTRDDYEDVAVGGFGIGAGLMIIVATVDQLIRERKETR